MLVWGFLCLFCFALFSWCVLLSTTLTRLLRAGENTIHTQLFSLYSGVILGTGAHKIL